MPLEIRLNGAQQQLEAPLRLAELAELATAGPRDGIAVAVNGVVVPRGAWQEREVQHGDDIEIVRAVQGG
jgi:sulfur carrier protein